MRNWMDADQSDLGSREKRVKAFLDACAYLLLRDNAGDTMSHYKEMARGNTEIPVSSCPPSVSHLIDGGQFSPAEEMLEKERFEQIMDCLCNQPAQEDRPKARRKPRPDTNSDRIARIKLQFPGCSFTHCYVDTENEFSFKGIQYAIDKALPAYQPKETRHGLLYDMDQVVVVCEANGTTRFYTQKLEPIDSNMVRMA